MGTYRIKEYVFFNNIKSWVVQRRSIFGFWYNPDNVDAYTTGWHDTLKEAKEAIDRKLTKVKSKIVFTNK